MEHHQFICDTDELRCVATSGERLHLCLRCQFSVRFCALKEQVEDPHPAIPEELLAKHKDLLEHGHVIKLLVTLLESGAERDVNSWIRWVTPVLNQAWYLMERFESQFDGGVRS